MAKPRESWFPVAKITIDRELARIRSSRRWEGLTDKSVAVGCFVSPEDFSEIHRGFKKPPLRFARNFADFVSKHGDHAPAAPAIEKELRSAKPCPFEPPDFNEQVATGDRPIWVSDVDYYPFAGLPIPPSSEAGAVDIEALKKPVADSFFTAVFRRRFFDLAGAKVQYLGGRPHHEYGDVSLALFDSVHRILQFQFSRVPIRIGLGAVCLRKHRSHLMQIARLLSNLETSHVPKIHAIVVSGEVGSVHCQKRLHLSEGHKITELSAVNPHDLAAAMLEETDVGHDLIPVVCCDELTALRVLGLLGRRGCSVFPMNSRRAGRDALDHMRRTRRELPQYHCSIAVKRRNHPLQEFMHDALRQFLSTEIETTASGWFKLAEELSRELHHLAEYISLERHLDDNADIAAMHRRADGRCWLHAWEWVLYTLSLDSESIDSYSAFDLPWKPILIRARQLVQLHLGAEEQREKLLAMADFLGPDARERLANLLEVQIQIPADHADNPSSEIVIDNLQRALRAEQPELSIDVDVYDPGRISIARKGMTAILREIKTMYDEEGFTDAVKRLDYDIAHLCEVYGGTRGATLLARGIDEPDGFIGGVCLTGLETESSEIRYLWVEPEYRTRRVGKRIIDRAIKAATGANCKSVYVEIIEQKLQTAYGLFTEMKFEVSSRAPNQEGRTVLERQL